MKGFRKSELLSGPFIAMANSEEEFRKQMKSLTKKDFGIPWLRDNAYATVNVFTSDDGDLAIIVSIPLKPKDEDFVVVSTLTHEAVHVFQAWCEHIGEDNPGKEVEAYAVQNIFAHLMGEYSRRRINKEEQSDEK